MSVCTVLLSSKKHKDDTTSCIKTTVPHSFVPNTCINFRHAENRKSNLASRASVNSIVEPGGRFTAHLWTRDNFASEFWHHQEMNDHSQGHQLVQIHLFSRSRQRTWHFRPFRPATVMFPPASMTIESAWAFYGLGISVDDCADLDFLLVTTRFDHEVESWTQPAWPMFADTDLSYRYQRFCGLWERWLNTTSSQNCHCFLIRYFDRELWRQSCKPRSEFFPGPVFPISAQSPRVPQQTRNPLETSARGNLPPHKKNQEKMEEKGGTSMSVGLWHMHKMIIILTLLLCVKQHLLGVCRVGFWCTCIEITWQKKITNVKQY